MIREYSPVNDELSNHSITGLYQEQYTTDVYFDTDFSDENKKIYLGRKDKNIVDTAYNYGHGASFNLDLFTEEDVDKNVKVWLATIPPPWYNEGH